MANDLGTIGINVTINGQPAVKSLAVDLNNIATAETKVSSSTKKIISDFKQLRDAQRQVAQANSLAAASFSKLQLSNVAKNLDTLTSSSLRYGSAAQQSANGVNRFGVITQQAGYQIGDFLVQVQSGTNWMVAFGQQATQMVGFLPLLSGSLGMSAKALIGISTGLGIAIPLVTALGAAWMRTSEGTDSAKESLTEVEQRLKSLDATLQDWILTRKAAEAGLTADELISQESLQSAEENLKKTRAEYEKLLEVFATKPTGLMGIGVEDYFLSQQEDLTAATEAYASAVERVTNLRNKMFIESANFAAEETKALEEKIYLQELSNKYGEDSYTVFSEQLRLQLESYRAELERKGVVGEVADALVLQLKRYEELVRYGNIALNQAIDIKTVLSSIGNEVITVSVNFKAAFSGFTGQAASWASKTWDKMKAIAQPGYMGSSPRPQPAPNDIDFGLPDFNRASGGARKLKDSLEEADKAAEKLRNELDGPLKSAVGSIADAFGDFMARGLTDFKGFVQDILKSFQNMISQMIAMAVKNRIMLSLGIGGITPQMAAAGQVAGLGSAGGLLGSLGIGKGIAGLAGGTGFLGGFGNAISGLAGGGAGFFGIGGNAALAGGGFLATVGAAIPVIGAVAAVFGLFKKKTKELDSGLRITVDNMDALVETFRTVQTTKFFGLSKKVKTTVEAASAEVSDPIVKAVQDIQGQIIKAAGVFGIAEETFANFLYDFEVSLKGLSEEQKIQKVNEELAKMGDSFAALTGHFETMNELLEAANQRMELQNRLDALLGNNQAILQRQREAEIAATHELNRPLLTAIYTLEDAQVAVNNAFAALRAAIDKTVEDLQVKLTAANEAVTRSRNIFQMLENALSGRYLRGSDQQTLFRRQGALGFLRRGDFSDEKQLEEALGVVSEPTEDLYRTFEDYARDFYYTSGIIEDAKKIADSQLSFDEQQVSLLEKQILDAEEQYNMMMQQYNALMGIDTSVKSVESAIQSVKTAIDALATAQVAAQAAANAGAGGGAGGGSSSSARDIINQLYKSGGYSTANQDVYNKWVNYASTQGTQAAIDAWKAQGNKGSVSKFAAGGMHSGGLRIVGERGPELEATGPARIYNNRQTAEMFRDPELANSVVELKNEVSRMRSEQLQIQLEISKNTKRIYDTERKWDVEGLPPERV